MKKIALFIFICLLAISNVNAKLSTTPYTGSNQQLRTSQDGIFKFGYCSDYIANGLGMGSLASVSAAIYMPDAKFGAYAGKAITTINIGLGEASTNVSVWIRNNLDGPNLIEKVVGEAAEGWNEIILDAPFFIPGEDIYIGYTATARFQIGVSSEDVKANQGWFKAPNSKWEDMKSPGYSPCIQAYIDLSGESIFDMGIEQLNKSLAIINEVTSMSAVLRNVSSEEAITSVKYTYEIDEQLAVEKTIATNIAPNSLASVDLPIDPINVAGMYNIKVTILEINGQADTFMANNSATNTHQIAHQFYPKKVIVEEGTGTWCTWCTRGIVGMEMMKEKYPESFIGIAVHNGDPMTAPTYDNFMVPRYYKSFPECIVNRKLELVGDPYYDIEEFFLSEMALESFVGIELSGEYTDASEEKVNLTTVSTFGLPEENANYRLSYVLIENGVTGTASGYTQINAYAGGASGPMGGYENKPSRITDQVFNDVARGIYSTTGIANSIPQTITELEPITHNYTITLPTTVQNKNNLEFIVMLLDKNREVVNANRIHINASNVGVDLVAKEENTLLTNIHKSKETLFFTINANDAVTINLYDISGRLISSEIKSINNSESISLSASGLSGVYLLKIQAKDKVSTKKIVL